jgi:UDP-glucose 4-epimerase
MNILITGAAGFLGSHLVDYFLKNHHKVIGVDNMIGGSEDNINPQSKFIKEDITELDVMDKICNNENVDIIYHCAATPHEGLSVFSPYIVSKHNFSATVSVVTAACKNKVKRIIYCSSMARYGAQKYPFTEDMKTKPVDPYGISKVAGEEILKNLCDVHGVEWIIAVPHNIIGPKQKYDDPYRNVVSIMLNRMMQDQRPIIYGDGEQTRCFSYIDDCLQCLTKMAFDKDILKQVINIGPDEEFITINKVAEICSNIVGFNQKPIYVPDRPQEVKHAVCSSDKARKLLNYKTTIDVKNGILKTYEYIKKKGTKKFKYHIDLEIVNDKTPLTWKNKLI